MDHTFSTEAIDGTEVSRISIEGELDIATVEQVEKAADAAIAARRPVVVDLAKCPFMDSTGLHWIVLVHQALTDEVGLDAPMAIVAQSGGPAPPVGDDDRRADSRVQDRGRGADGAAGRFV